PKLVPPRRCFAHRESAGAPGNYQTVRLHLRARLARDEHLRAGVRRDTDTPVESVTVAPPVAFDRAMHRAVARFRVVQAGADERPQHEALETRLLRIELDAGDVAEQPFSH